MWPFLLILAIVPMIFYWSDSVRALFPQLDPYLPDKASSVLAEPRPELAVPTAKNQADDIQWLEAQGDDGYVASALSLDRAYRVAVGCRTDAEAVLQVTHITGTALPDQLYLNYQYGHLQLEAGLYAGPELVGVVAQLEAVYLQNPAGEVLAQFQVDAAKSGLIARALEQHCVIVR